MHAMKNGIKARRTSGRKDKKVRFAAETIGAEPDTTESDRRDHVPHERRARGRRSRKRRAAESDWPRSIWRRTSCLPDLREGARRRWRVRPDLHHGRLRGQRDRRVRGSLPRLPVGADDGVRHKLQLGRRERRGGDHECRGEVHSQVVESIGVESMARFQMCRGRGRDNVLAIVSRLLQSGHSVVFQAPEYGSYIGNNKRADIEVISDNRAGRTTTTCGSSGLPRRRRRSRTTTTKEPSLLQGRASSASSTRKTP